MKNNLKSNSSPEEVGTSPSSGKTVVSNANCEGNGLVGVSGDVDDVGGGEVEDEEEEEEEEEVAVLSPKDSAAKLLIIAFDTTPNRKRRYRNGDTRAMIC